MTNPVWYIIPLTLCISLVYNTSRYEMPSRILKRAARMSLMILAGMAALHGLLFFLSVRL